MEPIESSETSAYINTLTPGTYPKEKKLHFRNLILIISYIIQARHLEGNLKREKKKSTNSAEKSQCFNMLTKIISHISLQDTAGRLKKGLSCSEDFCTNASSWWWFSMNLNTISYTQGYTWSNGVVFDRGVLCVFGDHDPNLPSWGSPCEREWQILSPTY